MGAMTGIHHVALTVSDLSVSAPWYIDTLGLVELLSGDDDAVSFRVLGDLESGLTIGLREYKATPHDRFNEFRTGLDHLAIGVETRHELSLREAALAAKGIAFTPSVDTPIGTVVVFRDPDGIQLEFWLAASFA
jgi:glyoxylase I family protein